MPTLTILLFSLLILHHQVTSELVNEEKEALLSFIANLPHNPSYNLNDSVPACNWKGVKCDPTNTNFQQNKRFPKQSLEAPTVASVAGTTTEGERNKLVLFDDGIESSDFEDLLQASVEVLGKGSVGTSYKHVMKAKKMTVVVKRMKDVATKMEFESCMEVLGKLKNEYVVSLRYYCYLEDEKWLVYDYIHHGSLFDHLHGSLILSGTRLDWNNRMSIALSAAKGVAYLHMCSVVHGNIKSSNILLRQETNKDATVSDYVSTHSLVSGAPRTIGPLVITTQKFSFKFDVYSFEVFLLELLTGKDPNDPSSSEVENDFPMWVQSVVREEPKAEIFDVELRREENIKVMNQMLRIAKDCISIVVDQRLTGGP
ncbi:hypothetical protein L1987_70192 [Smallanthus sonchifolius]|uniref:Uncharacterized protein n=1 Tax=Smallanthus sonchifolius TaxID=185202 RepID=A0ACB9APM5_9ASTR|nr:hypothetical protein L1987_70192 [Smallanthus sonchifolius]